MSDDNRHNLPPNQKKKNKQNKKLHRTLSAAKTATVQSNDPDARTFGSFGFHCTVQTSAVWGVYVCKHVSVRTSHSFTVLSADADASNCRSCRFHDNPNTALVWLPALNTVFLRPFLPFPLPLPLCLAVAVVLPPSSARGSMGLMTSRSQISMCSGSIMPTATKLPTAPSPAGGRHNTDTQTQTQTDIHTHRHKR